MSYHKLSQCPTILPVSLTHMFTSWEPRSHERTWRMWWFTRGNMTSHRCGLLTRFFHSHSTITPGPPSLPTPFFFPCTPIKPLRYFSCEHNMSYKFKCLFLQLLLVVVYSYKHVHTWNVALDISWTKSSIAVPVVFKACVLWCWIDWWEIKSNNSSSFNFEWYFYKLINVYLSFAYTSYL